MAELCIRQISNFGECIQNDLVSLCLYYLDQSKKRLKNQETKSTNSISTMGSSDSSSSSSSIESDGSDHESTLQSREPDKIFFKTPGFSGKATKDRVWTDFNTGSKLLDRQNGPNPRNLAAKALNCFLTTTLALQDFLIDY